MKSAFYIFSKQRHRTKPNFTFASSNCLPVVLDVKLQPPIKSMTKTSEFATLNPKPLPREAHNPFMLREADSPFHEI
jgi:hypothetical protein